MANLTQLYDKHIDNLFMFGTKFTADRELIKDCIQDVSVKLFNKRAQLDKVNNISHTSMFLSETASTTNSAARHTSATTRLPTPT